MLLQRLTIFIVLLALIPSFAVANQSETALAALFEKLSRGEVVAIMRHAIAPGTGDPENFTLGKCDTQRNLSTEGRNQAKKIGELFRQYGIESAKMYSSQWCRCIDTAVEMQLGKVAELPFMNSFFQSYSKEPQQTQALKTWLQNQKQTSPIILVTHQVNITALTGVFPSSGEIVFIRTEPSGEIVVEGTIKN